MAMRRLVQSRWPAAVLTSSPAAARTHTRSTHFASATAVDAATRYANGSGGTCRLLPLALAGCTMAGAACLAAGAEPAEAAWWPFSRKSESPFDYPELRRGIKRRSAAEQELQKYMEEMRTRCQELLQELQQGKVARAVFEERMRALRLEAADATQRIAYGVAEQGARARYESEYGCCRWTDAAIAAAAAHAPIIEIGAGRGHWQRALAQAGVDAVAFDSGASPRPLPGRPPIGKVKWGDEAELPKHPGRTLLLVYPPPGGMAEGCLRQYRGDVLLYVGEGRGGVNASDAFFDALAREWEVEKVVELDPFPECFERMFVLRRRNLPPQPAAPPLPAASAPSA